MTETQAAELLTLLTEIKFLLINVHWAASVLAVCVPVILGCIVWYYIRDSIRGRGLFG